MRRSTLLMGAIAAVGLGLASALVVSVNLPDDAGAAPLPAVVVPGPSAAPDLSPEPGGGPDSATPSASPSRAQEREPGTGPGGGVRTGGPGGRGEHVPDPKPQRG